MTMLVSSERDLIPINSFLSSWYWFRKEHQTRLEFALRHIDLPVEAPVDVHFDNAHAGAPVRPRHPNAGDVIFRYGKRSHIEGIVHDGAIRISPASSYKAMEDDTALQDTEESKASFQQGERTRITSHAEGRIPGMDDDELTASSTDYYVFCASCDWDRNLFTSFDGADACLIIKDVEEFGRRLESAASARLSGWRCFHGPVHYFDPYERVGYERINLGISKDFKYAYQREYRFLWMPLDDQPTYGPLDLNLGNVGELLVMHGNSGRPLPR